MSDTNIETVDDGFVSLNGFHKFESKGERIEGVLLYSHRQAQKLDGKPGLMQHTILTAEGFVTFNETSQLKMLSVLPPGTHVKIRYDGETSEGTNRIRHFDIRIDPKQFKNFSQKILNEGGLPKTAAITAVSEDVDPFAEADLD